jgi:murein DD-endopeptidase MepM/ murein hydrolase activator NlpD
MENENIQSTKKKTNVKGVLSKYGYYIALAILILMLALAIVLTSISATNEVEETQPTNADVITFTSPVLNPTVLKGYSDTELQYNKTLNVWEVHKAVDFAANVGEDVLAVYDGTVTKLTTNLLEGTVIEIDHGNGLKTTYGSLDSNTQVKVGDTVKQGDVIGKASNTATSEVSESGEVHFEVWKDGNLVDPASYLDISTTK